MGGSLTIGSKHLEHKHPEPASRDIVKVTSVGRVLSIINPLAVACKPKTRQLWHQQAA